MSVAQAQSSSTTIQEAPFFGGYSAQSTHYDELLNALVNPSGLAKIRGIDPTRRQGRIYSPLGTSAADAARERRHLQCAWRSDRTRSAVGTRPVAVDLVGIGMGDAFASARTACAAAESGPRGFVWPAVAGDPGNPPPEIIFANPLFLRACHSVPVAHGNYIPFYAAHVARNASGKWQLLADRTQAPSGAGYAVENRILLSRMLPDTYQACEVQRLAGFFISVRDTLRSLAPKQRENPRIVLLSPAPRARRISKMRTWPVISGLRSSKPAI